MDEQGNTSGAADEPPPGEAWWSLDEPLRVTLERSFEDRMAGQVLAGNNLDNAWYGGEHPRTTWEAIQCAGPQCLNVLTRLYGRIQRIDPSGQAWQQIKYLRNGWWGGSAGFKVVYQDPDAMRSRLTGLFDRVAPDLLIGALEHQHGSSTEALWKSKPADLLSPSARPPDCDTYREVDKLGQESVHFCVAIHDDRPTVLDDVHVDWCSPVIRADPDTRRCVYDWPVGAEHWLQAMLGVEAPVFPFDRIGDEIGRVSKLQADGKAPEGGAAAAWDAWTKRWLAAKWSLAAKGKAGHDEVLGWLSECRKLGAAW